MKKVMKKVVRVVRVETAKRRGKPTPTEGTAMSKRNGEKMVTMQLLRFVKRRGQYVPVRPDQVRVKRRGQYVAVVRGRHVEMVPSDRPRARGERVARGGWRVAAYSFERDAAVLPRGLLPAAPAPARRAAPAAGE